MIGHDEARVDDEKEQGEKWGSGGDPPRKVTHNTALPAKVTGQNSFARRHHLFVNYDMNK